MATFFMTTTPIMRAIGLSSQGFHWGALKLASTGLFAGMALSNLPQPLQYVLFTVFLVSFKTLSIHSIMNSLNVSCLFIAN